MTDGRNLVSGTEVECAAYSQVSSAWSQTYLATCVDGKAEVKLYLYLCGRYFDFESGYCASPPALTEIDYEDFENVPPILTVIDRENYEGGDFVDTFWQGGDNVDVVTQYQDAVDITVLEGHSVEFKGFAAINTNSITTTEYDSI